MKVAVTQERRAPAEPPIPLDRPVKRELEKEDYLVYKLRNNPADPTSGGYDLTIPYFRDGTPGQFLIPKEPTTEGFHRTERHRWTGNVHNWVSINGWRRALRI
jgi:hypothetical protein